MEACRLQLWTRSTTISTGLRLGSVTLSCSKKISGSEIWEFRTKYDKMTYRLFAFWDKEGKTLVVATHGMIKKTQKTPLGEIAKAERMRKEYFEDKKKGD